MGASARALASLLLGLLLTSSPGALGAHPGLVARVTAKGLEYGKAQWPSAGLADPLGTRLLWVWQGHRQAHFFGPGWDSGPCHPTTVSLRHLLVLAGFLPAKETRVGCKRLVWEVIPGHTRGGRKCETGEEASQHLKGSAC